MAFGKFDPFHDKPSPYPLHSVPDACALAQARDADHQIKAALQVIERAGRNLDDPTRAHLRRNAESIRRVIQAYLTELQAGRIAKEMTPLLPGDVRL